MKKLKLLLPIAAVGTVAAAATPLLVSCGANQNAYSKTINGSEVYIPTIERAKSDKTLLDTDEANTLYWKDVKENKDVILQDLLYSITSKAYIAKRGVITPENARNDIYKRGYIFYGGDTNIHINYTNLTVDATKKTISINVEGSCVADLYLGKMASPLYIQSAGRSIDYGTVTLDLSHFKFEFENIPYGVSYEEVYDYDLQQKGINHWIIGPEPNADSWLDSTKIKLQATGSAYSSAAGRVYVYNNESTELTNKTKWPEHIVVGDAMILAQALLFIYGTSYHLSDIGVIPEEE